MTVQPLKPLSSIQEPLEVGLKVLAILDVTVIAITPFVYAQYSKLPPSTKLAEATTSADAVIGTVGILELVASAGVVVMFLMWVYRATKNLRMLTDYPFRQTPGWSVGWYFVPIALLFKPYDGMTDIWKASGAKGGRGMRLTWWLLVISSSFVMNATGSDYDAATVKQSLWFGFTDTLNGIVGLATAIATLLLVSRIGNAYSSNVHEWSLKAPAVAAGWYDDPSGSAGQRYWDGSQWTDATTQDESNEAASV